MPNIAEALKTEMARVTRKTTRAEFDRLSRENLALRRALSELRKRTELIERSLKLLDRQSSRVQHQSDLAPAAEQVQAQDADTGGKVRFRKGGIEVLRRKLELGNREIARLVGATPKLLAEWDEGVSRPTPSQTGLLASLRSLRPVDAKALLERAA